MGYIAGVRLDLGTRVAEIGDPVPEAEGWSNLHAYLQTGQVVEVDDEAGGEASEGRPPAPRRSTPRKAAAKKPAAKKPAAKRKPTARKTKPKE